MERHTDCVVVCTFNKDVYKCCSYVRRCGGGGCVIAAGQIFSFSYVDI